MIVIVAYDIADDASRSHVAARLQARGDRVQKSVFMLEVDGDDLAALTSAVTSDIDTDKDRIAVWRQCAACWAEQTWIGQAGPPSRPLHWAVF